MKRVARKNNLGVKFCKERRDPPKRGRRYKFRYFGQHFDC